jgi:hypothetical protein
MKRTAIGIWLAIVCSCVGSPGRKNPEGYSVHILTGESLTATAVAINGRAIDTTSAAAIDSSVRGIIDGAPLLRTVEEVTGVVPDLTIDFTGPATPVPATFHGANLQWRSKFYLHNPRWRALVTHMKLGLLRFPGGQERVRYDGKLSTAGTPQTDTLTVTADQPYEFRMSGEDVASYISLCRELGIEAEPELNLTVNDPAMWADLVRQIVDDLGYDLRYVSMGNEPDVKSYNGNWPYFGADGSSDDERRANAIAHYAARYLAYRQAIDAVKPGMTHAFGELGGDWSPSGLGARLDAILSQLGGAQPGAVATHWYMLGNWAGQATTEPGYPALEHVVATGNGTNNIGYVSTIASAVRDRALANGLDRPKIFLGEFGVSWSATPMDATIADRLVTALFNAEAQETGKAAGFDSMQWFGISDPAIPVWVPSLIEMDDATGTPRPRPQYYVYLMYKYLYGNETVAVPGGHQPEWSIYASRASGASGASQAASGGNSYLMLINRTAATEVTRVVKVSTASGGRLLRLTLHPHSLAIVSF